MTEPFGARTSRGNERLSSQRFLTAQCDSMVASAGTYRFPIGFLSEGGAMVRAFHVIPGVTLVPSATNFYSFQPVIVRADGSARQVGTPRTTATLGMTSGVPFRLHEETALSERLFGESVVAVDITVTGTPTGSAILTRPTFQVEYTV